MPLTGCGVADHALSEVLEVVVLQGVTVAEGRRVLVKRVELTQVDYLSVALVPLPSRLLEQIKLIWAVIRKLLGLDRGVWSMMLIVRQSAPARVLVCPNRCCALLNQLDLLRHWLKLCMRLWRRLLFDVMRLF